MNHGRVESASLSIGKVARRAGIGVETIRFYEREGLLAATARRDSGYRLYHERVIFRIRFIKRAKELGFSLKEIKELLQLRRNSSSTCEDIREKAEAKIVDRIFLFAGRPRGDHTMQRKLTSTGSRKGI